MEHDRYDLQGFLKSRPARGAGIEIPHGEFGQRAQFGRAPQGARGLKSQGIYYIDTREPVAPRKGRGD